MYGNQNFRVCQDASKITLQSNWSELNFELTHVVPRDTRPC